MNTATPFSKLLIANRGEIAVRVMRTARAMGYGTVAVYSRVDAGAVHVEMADEAVCIGGAAPSDSYLCVDRIVAAALATGADAIHPGYGFLAENPALPMACAEHGIVFVGPSAAAMERMGDKAAAKSAMQAAGVPCIPGYAGENQSADTLLDQARGMGFPLMIKATAGGGGRGMRLVTGEADFPENLASAVSEATTAFGDGTVLLERAIVNPRHVEIQVMADRHGNVIHLGERDCSVQRRHQKIIEEAPSPAVDATLRARMGEISCTAARAIGYEGAGTFEYLLDAEGGFHFMEMNTRLQVEHPVTEAVTGLDLVELQLRIAAGERLPLTQQDVVFSGHAMEARLCAEDPVAGFIPQSGIVDHWRPGCGVRVDHALRDAAVVPPDYDPMLAKFIAHGPDRDAARQGLARALRDSRVLGLRTNQAYLNDCLDHPEFVAGKATTGFAQTHGRDLFRSARAGEVRAAAIAAALMRAGETTALAHGFPTPMRLSRDGREYCPMVRALPHGQCHVTLDGETYDVHVISRDRGRVDFETDGVRAVAHLLERRGRVWLHLDGCPWDFLDLTIAAETTAQVGADGKIRAMMNGRVASVVVKQGDRVRAGQTVLVLEAMKMEHAHTAPVDGVMASVVATPGSQVAAHSLLAEVDPDQAG